MGKKHNLFQTSILMMLFFAISNMAKAEEYTGNLNEEGSGNSWSATADIPITLASSSYLQVSFTTDPCSSTGESVLLFYMLNNDDSTLGLFSKNVEDEISSKVALAEGNYLARVTCSGTQPEGSYNIRLYCNNDPKRNSSSVYRRY